ncbi:MAG: PA0069 family radical SAM protein [Gammaproteobacteria bacterium]
MNGNGSRKGRGITDNPAVRYHAENHEPIDDGWDNLEHEPPPLATEVTLETPRSLIARNRSPDVPFEQSINPYRGCEHGCSYCYARPTHAYWGLSPGLDFETKLTVKKDAARVLRKELEAGGYRCSPIALGANTDPYQPIEREYRITREILEILNEYHHPCLITTKSALIERDIDVLAPMAERNLVRVNMSLSTLRPAVARTLEPRAASPQRRLKAIATLRQAGIGVDLLAAPVIPVLTDPELEAILAAAASAGVEGAGYVLLRLPLEVAPLFERWLHTHAPDSAEHVLKRITDSRSGRKNDPRFGSRMTGEGFYADMIAQRFRLAVRKLGLNENIEPVDTTQFRTQPQQLDLFS